MVTDKSLYSHLAGLLEYPREDIKLRAEEAVKALSSHPEYPVEAMEQMKRFQKDLDHFPLDDLQGIYSYTFELTSDYSLDMGYHLYDGFKRAGKLATVKTMYREQGFPVEEFSRGELPDNLAVILHFLGFTKDEAIKRDFLETFVIMAMEKLYKNFERNQRNLYSHLINAIYMILDNDVKEGK